MKLLRTLTTALILALAAPLGLASPGAHGPNGEHLDTRAGTAGFGLARLPDGSVTVPKLAQRRMGIRTVMAPEASVARSVELNGRTSIDPNAGGRVQAPFAGRVEAGPGGIPVAGTPVRKGQVLLVLRPVSDAAERGNQQAVLAEARASRTLLERRVRRLEALEGTVPAKEVEAARAELAAVSGREKAVANAVNGREAIIAPASGVIASAGVLNGQVVEARDVLFEIVDPDRMLVEAQVTDPKIAFDIAGAQLAGLPGGELQLAGVARTLRDGALPVTFRVKGKALPLAVGQPVTVIATLRSQVRGVTLPAEALARNPANQTIVWIKSGAHRFIAQVVEAQPLDARRVVVTRGLGGDNRVVVSGASLINQIR